MEHISRRCDGYVLELSYMLDLHNKIKRIVITHSEWD